MSVRKSFIEDVELSTGTQLTVQVNGRRASLSIDGSETNMSIWLEQEELQKLADQINKILEEVSSEQVQN